MMLVDDIVVDLMERITSGRRCTLERAIWRIDVCTELNLCG
jgi:hypothetical protein